MRSMHISLHHGAAEKCWYGNYEQSVGSCEVSSRLDFVSAWLSSFHIGAGYTTDFLPCFTGWLGGLFRIQTYSNLFWHIQTIRGTCVLAYACHSLIPNVIHGVHSWPFKTFLCFQFRSRFSPSTSFRVEYIKSPPLFFFSLFMLQQTKELCRGLGYVWRGDGAV